MSNKIPKFSNQFGNEGFQPISNPYTEGADTDKVVNLVVDFLSNLIGFLTVLGSLFFIVNFFMGAFSWITSGGDSGKVEKARSKMLNAVLGVVLIVIAYSLIGIVGKLVGIDLINLGDTIRKLDPKNI